MSERARESLGTAMVMISAAESIRYGERERARARARDRERASEREREKKRERKRERETSLLYGNGHELRGKVDMNQTLLVASFCAFHHLGHTSPSQSLCCGHAQKLLPRNAFGQTFYRETSPASAWSRRFFLSCARMTSVLSCAFFLSCAIDWFVLNYSCFMI